MKIAFVMDPLEKLRVPWDTSTTLLMECQRRGFSVYTATISDLFIHGGHAMARLTQTEFHSQTGYHRCGSPKDMSLGSLSLLWMRKDPPIDRAYLDACQILSQVPRGVPVINPPLQLMSKNEKLFALEFRHWTAPTLVTASVQSLGRFLQEMEGRMVVKPLHNRGGRGVRLLEKRDRRWKKILERMTRGGTHPILAQEFLPEAISQGSKRILFVDGRPLPPFLRLPPANVLQGQALRGEKEAPCSLTPLETKMCRELGAVFRRLGLFFVGIDLIGGKLIEINITSPAGIPELNKLYGGNYEAQIIDAMIRKYFSDWRKR